MKLAAIALTTAFALSSTFALAQSGGGGSGAGLAVGPLEVLRLAPPAVPKARQVAACPEIPACQVELPA
jgi:hypothetical protein